MRTICSIFIVLGKRATSNSQQISLHVAETIAVFANSLFKGCAESGGHRFATFVLMIQLRDAAPHIEATALTVIEEGFQCCAGSLLHLIIPVVYCSHDDCVNALKLN